MKIHQATSKAAYLMSTVTNDIATFVQTITQTFRIKIVGALRQAAKVILK